MSKYTLCMWLIQLVGFGPRPVGEDDAIRVQARVQHLDPGQRGLDQLAGGDLAGADQPGLLGRPGIGELVPIQRGRTIVRP